ncbi:MAG: UDP-N-acetylmuramate--L-alanine ligase [Bacteroidia bacterium]|nr:MAG: UDP-N-acetylmuramate--L-alanine ligase [Bacteroidia bacterium]
MKLIIKEKIHHISYCYLLGIGGIGMSALALYFKKSGIPTAGYDKVSSPITDTLQAEGIQVHFEDAPDNIPKELFELPPSQVLLIYTPAVPADHKERNFLINKGFSIYKRSEVLGAITGNYKTAAVAGTHGKTSVSTLIAHIFKVGGLPFNGFLGGISKNYDSNLLLHTAPGEAEYAVTEADEYDRSFLELRPHIAVITAIDPDHLDIYGTFEELQRTFRQFAERIDKDGVLILKKGVELPFGDFPSRVFSYSLNESADFYAENICLSDFETRFDLVTPSGKVLKNLSVQIPGKMHVENAVAASAVSLLSGVCEDNLRKALASWEGVKRRFDYIVRTPNLIYIDDYAHHPEEIRCLLNSLKSIYKNRKITGIFQPHLYSRTQDFAEDFAESLSLLDELILLDIYPARELPIPGVSSRLIFDKVQIDKKVLMSKEDIPDCINLSDTDILLTIGAGDIDRLVDKIREKILNLNEKNK